MKLSDETARYLLASHIAATSDVEPRHRANTGSVIVSVVAIFFAVAVLAIAV